MMSSYTSSFMSDRELTSGMDDFPRRAPVTDQLSPLLENHKGRDSNTSVASEIPLTTPHQPFHFVSWPVGMSFDINYILGVGVLSIPISFYNGGPALGVLFLLFVTVVSGITVNWLLETQARARSIKLREASEMSRTMSTSNMGVLNVGIDELEDSISLHAGGDGESLESDEEVDPRDQDFYAEQRYKITTKKYENNELCAIFMGPYAKFAYEVTLFLFACGGMWSYAAVFATSTATYVPLVDFTSANECSYPPLPGTPQDQITTCNNAYYIWISIFAALVIPISCLEMTEQWLIQVTLTCYRFVALFLMIVTVYIAMFAGPYKSYSITESAPFIATDRSFHWAGFSSVFSTAVFAQMMHHSVPGLSQHVDQKSKLRTMFFSGFTITFLFYSLLGVLCSLYFGPGTQGLVTLNWTTFTGLTFNGALDYSVGARFLSYLIILFPVFDILSAFPLNAITVGNNIFYGLPPRYTNYGKNRLVKIACRMCAALPPLVLGTIFHEVATIISFTGTLGFFLAFIFPGLLQLTSMKRCKQVFGDSTTPFTWHFSHPWYAIAIVILAFIGFVFMLVDLSLQTAGVISA